MGRYRNKVYYGGRGGAKSHNIARALLVLGAQKPIRIACAREIQKSIKDSVYQLLADLVRLYKLESFYTVQADRIIGKNGTTILFLGLKHNITGVKSLEGVDIVWVEEAENVSDNSWEVLIPTVRKPNSEIWVSFNPKNPTDPTWVRFVERAGDETLLMKVSYRDNPFFPDVLEKERAKLEQNDPDAHAHIWEGEFDTRHTGYVYANQIMHNSDKHILVPHTDGVPVFTAWDLGKSDSTAIWFGQIVGFQTRVIDYFEENNRGLSFYAEELRKKPYEYSTHYLPHDARHDRLGMEGSIQIQLEGMGLKTKIVQNHSVEGGIEKARSLLTECYIDKEKCHDGLHALNNYKYEWDDNRNTLKTSPLHDWSSHAADGFRYFAFAASDARKQNHAPTSIKSTHSIKTISKFKGRGKR